MDISLRDRLRRDLRDAHERLDARVSRFDLGTSAGLIAFLDMQARALPAIIAAAPQARCRPAAEDLLTRAHADLAVLGWGLPPVQAMDTEGVNPLAADYVIAGSRLGTTVLRKRWETAGAEAARAQAYFTAPPHLDLWRDFCSRAGALPGEGRTADLVLAGADRLFAHYETCAAQAAIGDSLPHAC